jgi:acyl dehydratase
MVGVDNMKFLTPVHPGETITAEAVLKEKRLTKKPDRGIVVLSHVLKNSRDVVVLAADITYLIRTQAPAS